MGQYRARRPSLTPFQIVLIILGVIALGVLLWLGWQLLNRDSGTAGRPTGTRQIVIDTPQAGAAINSPFELRGRTSGIPGGSNLVYRVFDEREQLVGTGVVNVASGNGTVLAYATLANYSTTGGGAGRIEVVDLNASSGAVQAIATVRVSLGVGGPAQPTAQATMPGLLPTAGPGEVVQHLTIDTPAPGTVVGSPVVITGRAALYPQSGVFGYRVVNAAGAQIGAGTFQALGTSSGPATFTASLNFQVPAGPTSIRVEIFDQNPSNGAIVASTSIELRIGEPPPLAQAIIIETPPPGTFVGSPVVLTGRTTQFPFQGNLAWLAIDQGGRRLGNGIFDVNGSPGQPTSFTASLTFELPPNGGVVRFEVYDQDAVTGATVARSTIDLQITPPPPVTPTFPTGATATASVGPTTPPQNQQIFIDTPPLGTQVGSPVVITGRTVQYPFGGQLYYRFRDTRNIQLGSGAFPVAGQPGGPGSFNARLLFDEPASGGPIFLDIFELGPDNTVRASTTISLIVAPPPQLPTESPGQGQGVPTNLPLPIPTATPVGQPTTLPPLLPSATPIGQPTTAPPLLPSATPIGQPTASLPTATPVGQPTAAPPLLPTATGTLTAPIVIDSPEPDTLVGSPMVITGRTNLFPNGGTLFFQVLDLQRNLLGEGEFRIFGAPGGISPFNVSLEYDAPQGGGPIVLELFTRNEENEAENVTILRLNASPPAPTPGQGP